MIIKSGLKESKWTDSSANWNIEDAMRETLYTLYYQCVSSMIHGTETSSEKTILVNPNFTSAYN